MNPPVYVKDVEQLEELLSHPSADVIDDLKKTDGDFIVLGAGGKMGPSLSVMIRRALQAAGEDRKVYAVSRFSSQELVNYLTAKGIETIKGDLLDREFLQSLPKAQNVIYMAGMKFGSTQKASMTWALNTLLPALVAETFHDSRIISFSTGNVYPFVPVSSGGCDETFAPAPIGEYAQSCLGRERMFEYFSHRYHTPGVIIRLNYAVELRYGVLVDIALNVKQNAAIDVEMGYCNVIWQGDANAMILRSLLLAESPPKIMNITGPEIVSVRWIARQFGEKFNVTPQFVGQEADTFLLNNASQAHKLFGYPHITIQHMIDWIADWIERDMPLLNKPTHFQVRNGKF